MRTIFDFSAENAKIADWLAEQNEFELAVRFLNSLTAAGCSVR
jgi:hypothetical protein